MNRHAAPRREAPAMIATAVTGLAVIATGVAVVITAHITVKSNPPERPAISSSVDVGRAPPP
ncbi:MAG: hypothetical protein WAK82_39905 [Streptosporangiaceae bacterium]